MRLNNPYNFLFSFRTLIFIFICFGLFWLASLHHRYIEADECILGEQSYSFLKEGYVKVKSIPAIENWDVRMYAHHRFFTWFGAGIIGLFGWSITWLKISILPWYGLFFYFLYRFFNDKNLDKKYFILAGLLIFTTPIILLKSFSFRPDIILMVEGIALLYFLCKYRESKKVKYLLMAGAAAGLGFLTHLNGAAFCIAGFMFLLIRKEYKALIPYTAAGAIIGGWYFFELIPGDNFERFIHQLTHWPTINHGENFVGEGGGSLITGRLSKLLSEHKRFFWGDRVMGFSILFFFTLILNFRYLARRHADLLLFFLLLVLSLNIFGSHVAERYILFYYGVMTIVTSLGIIALQDQAHWKKVFIVSPFVFHLLLGGLMLSKIMNRSKDYIVLHAETLALISDANASILVPYEMIYNEFPNRDLYVYKTYEYLGEELPSGKMTQEQLFVKAVELGMDYIVINEQLANDKGRWFYNWRIEQNSYYETFYQDSKRLILKRI